MTSAMNCQGQTLKKWDREKRRYVFDASRPCLYKAKYELDGKQLCGKCRNKQLHLDKVRLAALEEFNSWWEKEGKYLDPANRESCYYAFVAGKLSAYDR